MKTTTTNAVRPLNMEEKRKLEKIIFEDIDRAVNAYEVKLSEDRDTILSKLIGSKTAKKLLADFIANQAEEKRIVEALNKLGLQTNLSGSYSDDTRHTVLQSKSYFDHKETKSLEEKGSAIKGKLHAMKRTYTLKLFASGMEAQEVFEALQAELNKLTG